MRTLTVMTALAALVLGARPALAQTTSSAPAAQAQAQRLYEQQKKSVALAVTLEALCPIAGAGALYAGDSDKATVLGILSGVSGTAGAGALLWLIHLEGEHASGGSRVELDIEQGAAISLLVTAGVIYLVARISGLSLAPDATAAFNLDLGQRLGVPSEGPGAALPSHALAPLPSFVFRF